MSRRFLTHGQHGKQKCRRFQLEELESRVVLSVTPVLIDPPVNPFNAHAAEFSDVENGTDCSVNAEMTFSADPDADLSGAVNPDCPVPLDHDNNACGATNLPATDAIRGNDFSQNPIGVDKACTDRKDTANGHEDVVISTAALPALNDPFEPNDSVASPANIGPIFEKTLPYLTIAAGDDDWFQFEISAPGIVVVAVLYDNPGDAMAEPVTLELRDSIGSSPLVASDDLLDADGRIVGKELQFFATTGQVFRIHVTGSSQEQIEYTLQIVSTPLQAAAPGIDPGIEDPDNRRIVYDNGANQFSTQIGANVDISGSVELVVSQKATTWPPVTVDNDHVPGSAVLKSSASATRSHEARINAVGRDAANVQQAGAPNEYVADVWENLAAELCTIVEKLWIELRQR